MPFIIVIALVALAWWYYRKAHKRRTTRAIIYTAQMFNDEFNEDKVSEANILVQTFDNHVLDEMELEVRGTLYSLYGGNRSAAIRHAQIEGFRG